MPEPVARIAAAAAEAVAQIVDQRVAGNPVIALEETGEEMRAAPAGAGDNDHLPIEEIPKPALAPIRMLLGHMPVKWVVLEMFSCQETRPAGLYRSNSAPEPSRGIGR